MSGVLVVLGSLLLSGCSTSGSPSQAQSTRISTPISTPTAAVFASGPSNTTIIVPNNDLFAPYITMLNVGDTVTWVNQDTVLHTIVTAPTEEGGALNPTQFQYVLGAGKSASLTLRQPGLYYYYCDAHATLPEGGTTAAARPGVRAYPLPMDGFLYVKGTGISAAANQMVSMTTGNRFVPWITILTAGETVTWTNQAQRVFNVRGVPGYGLLNPTSLAFRVAPGGSSSMTFGTVGIYDYYATEGARLAPVWLRPEALPGATGYPVPMEGIVAVFP
ncbi:MAG TPA: plastocyanin/azurin family copper-binding protein [Ktedonobacterales bacterium]